MYIASVDRRAEDAAGDVLARGAGRLRSGLPAISPSLSLSTHVIIYT